jgi:hypothetical protein
MYAPDGGDFRGKNVAGHYTHTPSGPKMVSTACSKPNWTLEPRNPDCLVLQATSRRILHKFCATALMFTHCLLVSLGLLAGASELSRPKSFDCGTNTAHTSDEFLKTIAELHGKPNSGSPAARAAPVARNANTGPISVDTVFHIVAKTDEKSSITNKMPSAQLNALNTAYKPYDISFNLINVTWPINDAWAVDEKADDHAMKKGLRQ